MTRKSFLSSFIKTLPAMMFFSIGEVVNGKAGNSKSFTVYRDVLSKGGDAFDHKKFHNLVSQTDNYARLHAINLAFMQSGQIVSMDKRVHAAGFTTKIVFRSEQDYIAYKSQSAGVFSDIKSLSSDYKIVRRS